MTDQAGSSNKTTEPTGPPPWERKWNDITEMAGKAVDSIVETAKKAVGSVQMPWERSWGGSSQEGIKTAPRASTALPIPVGALKTEKDMVKAAQFSPAELKQHAIEMKSPENIQELKKELSRATNPSVKKILEEELAKLLRS